MHAKTSYLVHLVYIYMQVCSTALPTIFRAPSQGKTIQHYSIVQTDFISFQYGSGAFGTICCSG